MVLLKLLKMFLGHASLKLGFGEKNCPKWPKWIASIFDLEVQNWIFWCTDCRDRVVLLEATTRSREKIAQNARNAFGAHKMLSKCSK